MRASDINNLSEDTLAVDCDQEPIHFPGCIQPHGVLLVLEPSQLNILQVSNNTFDFLGIHPQDLLNQNLSILLEAEQINLIQEYVFQEDLIPANPLEISITFPNNSQRIFDGILHRISGLLLLELESIISEKNHSFYNFYHLMKLSLSQLRNATSIETMSQLIVKLVRKLNGFDRVMVYQFDSDWNGHVIAEDKLETLPPYLGLNYPAADIPRQARELYRRNWLRLIPDIHYQPIEIVPQINPLTHAPLDLSFSVLRSVYPFHIEYLNNMGVTASMSISIIKNQQLWGLIACHHYSPKQIPYEIRTACEFVGQVASLGLANLEDTEEHEYQINSKLIQGKFLEEIASSNNLIEGLIKPETNLLKLVNAQGVIICFEGNHFVLGETPETSEIQSLVEWVGKQLQDRDFFYTDCLSKLAPEAEKLKEVASGLLALSISNNQKNYLFWLRPEVLQTVNWGGNPQNPVTVDQEGNLRLSPRKSFELWQEIVRGKSLPWKPSEIKAALELRSAIISVVLRQADELAKLNIELERSNRELDAFAYIASHDLKEPLRGIHNYSNFLIEDYASHLNEEGISKLNTLVRLTQRMENLIDSLLHFSRLGRIDLSFQKTDLNEVVHHILDLLSARIEETRVNIRIPRLLPVLRCDRIQIGEVFSNLISNAIKYNERENKWVEIGYIEATESAYQVLRKKIEIHQEEPPLILYVRDNGIGIHEKHLEAIFRIFKRLHSLQKYGGGTGAGLTIAKKIVERHNGNIWVESIYGEGSTFYFTLQV